MKKNLLQVIIVLVVIAVSFQSIQAKQASDFIASVDNWVKAPDSTVLNS